MRKVVVLVTNIVEEMYLTLVQEEPRCKTVHNSITPSLVEKVASAVKIIKVFLITIVSP